MLVSIQVARSCALNGQLVTQHALGDFEQAQAFVKKVFRESLGSGQEAEPQCTVGGLTQDL